MLFVVYGSLCVVKCCLPGGVFLRGVCCVMCVQTVARCVLFVVCCALCVVCCVLCVVCCLLCVAVVLDDRCLVFVCCEVPVV